MFVEQNIFLCYIHSQRAWRNSFAIATRYGLDGPGIEYQGWTRFSKPVYSGPGANSASFTLRIESLPGVNRSGRGAEDKEREVLYVYILTVSSRPVVVRNLSIPENRSSINF